MRSNSINATSNSHGNVGGRGSSKPPIPPKPNLQNQHRPLPEPNQQKLGIMSSKGVVTHNYYPSPGYSMYPTAVLIKDDDDIPFVGSNGFQSKNTIETLTPLSSRKCNEEQFKPLPQGVLPPLTKAEITPSYTLTQVNSRGLVGGRTLSSSAKNALLIEKIGGPLSYNDGSKEILPRANSNPESSSPLSITVNRSCIISVNNFNNSYNHNNNYGESDARNLRSKHRRSLNLDNPNLSSCSNVIINSVPNKTSVALPKNDLRCHGLMNDLSTCSFCNYYRSECRCESKDRRSYPVYVVHKKKEEPISASGGRNCPNGEFTDKGLLQYRSLNENCMPDQVDSSCDKLQVKLSNSSPPLNMSQSAPCSPATKPLLQKSEAVDMEGYDYYKRLSRGISRATDNVNIVSKARSEIAQGIWEALENGSSMINTPFFIETPIFTFTLPDLSVYSDEFRTFLEKDLIEVATLVSLEAAGRLNWWALIGASQRLWPLATTGDGNCLLHAASLGMWGFHDRLLTLRKALHECLTRSRFSKPLWRRWRWQLAMQNKETGLVLSHDEWETEWESVLRLASSAPRGGANQQENTTSSAPNLSQNSSSLSQGKLNADVSGPVYESLEEIHVLALAHVLRRPIIVVADTTLKDMNGDPLAPIPFGGIYLPLEWPPKECQRSPLLLTYDAAHFSALVVMEANEKEQPPKTPSPAVIPVTDCFHDLLPIQFLVDPGEDFVWGRDELDSHVIQKLTITGHDRKGLLNEYLDLVQVPIPSTYLEAASVGQEELTTQDMGEPMGDLDKKSSESSFDSDDGPPFSDGGGSLNSKSTKAPKQLQTVVKSFGSIGRSMSKRIKKNLNTLSKFSRSGSFRRKNHLLTKGVEFMCSKGVKSVRVGTHQNFILAAKIHTEKRQAYQQEMIENYLASARERFMRDGSSSNKKSMPRDLLNASPLPISIPPPAPSAGAPSPPELTEHDTVDGVQCINSGCTLYGTAQTSYMCTSCFNHQREEEEKEYLRQSSGGDPPSPVPKATSPEDSVPGKCEESFLPPSNHSPVGARGSGMQYGTGKSRFYATLDENSMKSATLIPVSHSVSAPKDKTLFLSNSTFYNDSVIPSSIPSYNLNRDLNLKKGKSATSGVPSSTSCIVSSRSSSSQSDPIHHPTSRFPQETTTKDTLSPICIDDVRVQVAQGGPRATVNHNPKIKVSGGANSGRNESTTPVESSTSVYSLSKPCLTTGCEFYGSSATNYLCSKCHLSQRKGQPLDSYTLDQVKYVQL